MDENTVAIKTREEFEEPFEEPLRDERGEPLYTSRQVESMLAHVNLSHEKIQCKAN